MVGTGGVVGTRPERCLCPSCGTDGALPAEPPKEGPACARCAGRLFVGRFALLEKLGGEDSGAAYKAFHSDLGTLASLRIFATVRASLRAAFFRRAELLARLDHPSFAAIYGSGEHDGRLYVVSRYPGGTRADEASLSLRESVVAIRDAALAVNCAHAANVIHGGLCPAHLWIAKQPPEPPSESLLRVLVDGWGPTPSGRTKPPPGAFAFLPPEQAQGHRADARSDVYSLGASLYALATGRPPFRGTSPDDVLPVIASGRFDPPSQVNPLVDGSLGSVIVMSMDRDPARRYPETSELAQDLTRWLTGGSDIRGPSTRIRERVPESVVRELETDRRKRFAKRAAIAGAFLLAVSAALLIGSRVSKPAGPVGNRPGPQDLAAAPGPGERPAAFDPRSRQEAAPQVGSFTVTPPPQPPAPGDVAGLGTLFFLHPRFGAFVRLEPGAKVKAGDVLFVVRGSEVVADLSVEMVTSPEPMYPHGCAVCPPLSGDPKAGDRVLRKAN